MDDQSGRWVKRRHSRVLRMYMCVPDWFEAKIERTYSILRNISFSLILFFFFKILLKKYILFVRIWKKNHCPTLPKCEIYSWFLKWNSLSLCWFFTLKNSMIYPFSQSLVFIDRINRCMCMYFFSATKRDLELYLNNRNLMLYFYNHKSRLRIVWIIYLKFVSSCISVYDSYMFC